MTDYGRHTAYMEARRMMRRYFQRVPVSFNHLTPINTDPSAKRFVSMVYSAGPRSLLARGESDFEKHVVAQLAFGDVETTPNIREVEPKAAPCRDCGSTTYPHRCDLSMTAFLRARELVNSHA